MDLDTASGCSPAPGNMLPAADTAHMQPDLTVQSVASSQAMQHVSHQNHHHQQQQQQQQQQGKHTPLSSIAAMQPLHEVHHAASTHDRTAERVTTQQQSPSTSQGSSQVHGTTHSTTQAASGIQGMRQGHAGQSPRHGHDDCDEEQQGAVTLQHASSTSAMMSLAQQASRNSHQQPIKRHNRHTGQLHQHHTHTL